MPAILTRSGRGATLDDVVEHLRHIVNVAGSEAVGVGTDWGKPYYQVMEWSHDAIAETLQPSGFDWVGWLPEHRFYPEEVCRGMETWDRWPHLTARLLERGVPEPSVVGIVGGNFLRFWREAAAS